MTPAGAMRLPGAVELRAHPAPDLVGLVTAGQRYFVRSWTTGAGPPAQELPEGDPPDDAPTDAHFAELRVMEEATCAAVGPALLVGTACGEIVVIGPGQARQAVQAHDTEVDDVAWLADGAAGSLGTDGECLRWRLASDGDDAGVAWADVPSAGAPLDLQLHVDRLAAAPLDARTLRGLAAELAGASSRGVTVLRACLQDPRPRVRYRTLWLIGEDGLWGFAHELATALHDPNETVRKAAVGAIDALDEVACTDPLRELLERETDPTVASLAAEVVERFAGDDPLPT